MARTQYIVPVFIPELACGNKCIFCNQKKITGINQIPLPEEIREFISNRLSQLPARAENIEIAFFGGNFTGIDLQLQKEYLAVAQYFIDKNRASSIRISTRPDSINYQNLELLNQFAVKTIELGAQSMCDEVLLLSGRGHTAEDTVIASSMIKEHGFVLGLQMMTGLPGDTAEKTMNTAKEIIRLDATETRIYPLLVFKNTSLYDLYLSGEYSPLSLDETIKNLSPVVRLFEESDVKILRLGLHPSDGMNNGDMVAGPWHPALRQMIYTHAWNSIIRESLPQNQSLVLRVSTEQFPNALGYQRKNAGEFPKIQFTADKSIKGMHYEVDYCR